MRREKFSPKSKKFKHCLQTEKGLRQRIFQLPFGGAGHKFV